MTMFPPPNSGLPPPVQYPGYTFTGYDVNGQPQYVPAATVPAPPVLPPQYQQPPVQGGFPAPGTPPPQGYAGYAPPPAAGGTIAFGETAWTTFLPVGQFVVTIDSIEAGVSQQDNEKLTFKATTVQPSGDVPAGRPHLWDYALTERAIGKLGRDLVNAGIDGKRHYPRNARDLAPVLAQELRGVQLVIRVTERKDDPERTNTGIVQRYGGGATQTPVTATPPGPPAAAPPAAPPPPVAAPPTPAAAAPPAPPSGGAVSFPQTPPGAQPPPPGAPTGTGFAGV